LRGWLSIDFIKSILEDVPNLQLMMKNASRIGDKVLIIQSSPISKTKKWRVREIVEKAV